jgi:hypothetical protein
MPCRRRVNGDPISQKDPGCLASNPPREGPLPASEGQSEIAGMLVKLATENTPP